MKSNANSKNATNSNTKSKKSSKDREKRKSQTSNEKNEHSSNEKGSPSKDSSSCKYAGIGPDSILNYFEQSEYYEHLSEDVRLGFSEDISYRLRYIIHDALVKARLSGRNFILSTDIEDTLKVLNVEKIYGATTKPNYIRLTKKNDHIMYLDDAIVNLFDISDQPMNYIQPGDVLMTRRFLATSNSVSDSLKTYFETICWALASTNSELKQAALRDIRTNTSIGPVIEWLYNFGYLMLIKDITYLSLTSTALDLIKALEFSAIGPQIVSEKVIMLLLSLLMQRLLRSVTTQVSYQMYYTIALLSERLPIRELVVFKLTQKLSEVKYGNVRVVPILTTLNFLGIDAIEMVFLPYMTYFLTRVEQSSEPELRTAILCTYNIIYKSGRCTETINKAFFEVFSDGLLTMWKDKNIKHAVCQREDNSIAIFSKLYKSRRMLTYTVPLKNIETIPNVFHHYSTCLNYYNNDMLKPTNKVSFRIKNRFEVKYGHENNSALLKYKNALSLLKLEEQQKSVEFKYEENNMSEFKYEQAKVKYELDENSISLLTNNVVVGKSTLLVSVFKNVQFRELRSKCQQHSLGLHTL